jgi:hypothetical protein
MLVAGDLRRASAVVKTPGLYVLGEITKPTTYHCAIAALTLNEARLAKVAERERVITSDLRRAAAVMAIWASPLPPM